MSGFAIAALVSFALCCGVLMGVMFALLLGYGYARKQQQVSSDEENALVEEISAKIAQEYIERSQEKAKTT